MQKTTILTQIFFGGNTRHINTEGMIKPKFAIFWFWSQMPQAVQIDLMAERQHT